jgi:NAD(P)-dependent dehydrogenase (short-subunit alcohol dehydrogenase family)
VNNAGIAVTAPIEGVALDDVRRQFEVNVVGPVAITQAVLPRLRASRERVVFVSSVSGRVSTPLTGVYSASKYALEAVADALRVELRPWGVSVVLVEPGAIDTDLWRDALETVDAAEAQLDEPTRALYRGHFAGARGAVRRIQKQAAPVEKVVEAIEKAVTAPRPGARYLVGTDARVQLTLKGALPTTAMDAAVAKITGTPDPA